MMMRGYFFAGSKIVDKQALGGFGTSQNFPKAITPDMNVPPGEISLIAEPDESRPEAIVRTMLSVVVEIEGKRVGLVLGLGNDDLVQNVVMPGKRRRAIGSRRLLR